MSEPIVAKNKDLIKTLTGPQVNALITKHMCLACVVGGGKRCRVKSLDSECITGYQEWLERDADIANWNAIRAALGITGG